MRFAEFADLLTGAESADPGAVTVWNCSLAGADGDGVLTAGEAARAARYRSPAARWQFVAARTALRVVLGRVLRCDPLAVVLDAGPDGKPFVPGRPVEFNVSHTPGVALVAVGPVPVGVDVERVRTVASAANLVDRYFSDRERAEFAALPAELRPAAFLRGWTLKEAVLKGIGCGVRDLDRCQVRLDPRAPPAIVAPADTAAAWSVTAWGPTADTVAALAVFSEPRA